MRGTAMKLRLTGFVSLPLIQIMQWNIRVLSSSTDFSQPSSGARACRWPIVEILSRSRTADANGSPAMEPSEDPNDKVFFRWQANREASTCGPHRRQPLAASAAGGGGHRGLVDPVMFMIVPC